MFLISNIIEVKDRIILSCVVAGSRKKRGQTFSDSAFQVAGERLVLSGKIQLSDFPVEISTSKWETSSFLYHKNTSRSIRLVELSASELPSPEARTFLAGISLITEILLD